MKKQFLTIILFGSFCTLLAQTSFNNEVAKSKLEVYVIPKLGFSKITETENVPLNGYFNGYDALISISMKKKFRFSTGISYFEINGNRNLAGGSASLKNLYLQIPLNVNCDFPLSKNIPENQMVFLSIGIGGYANDFINQQIETISETTSLNNLGWNFGFKSQFGLKFLVTKKMNLGIGFENQVDLSQVKSDNIEYKTVSSSVYFSLGYRLNK
ncbi:MAG: hypothetical protein ACOYOV_14160 [Bacteroidales bacterium]